MRIRLKGINSITKRLADGRLRTYWYAWKGGPPLRGEPGSPEFTASYNEACARKVRPAPAHRLTILSTSPHWARCLHRPSPPRSQEHKAAEAKRTYEQSPRAANAPAGK